MWICPTHCPDARRRPLNFLVPGLFDAGVSTDSSGRAGRCVRRAAPERECDEARVYTRRLLDRFRALPGVCWRARASVSFWTRADRKMLWSPAASSDQQRARVLTGVKARRCAPPPLRGLTALTPAPRTLVQTGSCRRCQLVHPLHVVVDALFRMTLFPATVDIEAVGAISNLHLNPLSTSSSEFNVDGFEPPTDHGAFIAYRAAVEPEFFEVVGIEILRGRNFNDADRPDTQPVVIIGEAMVAVGNRVTPVPPRRSVRAR